MFVQGLLLHQNCGDIGVTDIITEAIRTQEKQIAEYELKFPSESRKEEYLDNKTTDTTEVIEEEQTENIPSPVTNVPEFSFQIQ